MSLVPGEGANQNLNIRDNSLAGDEPARAVLPVLGAGSGIETVRDASSLELRVLLLTVVGSHKLGK